MILLFISLIRLFYHGRLNRLIGLYGLDLLQPDERTWRAPALGFLVSFFVLSQPRRLLRFLRFINSKRLI